MTPVVQWKVSGSLGTWSGIALPRPGEMQHDTAVRAFERNSGLKVTSRTEDNRILVVGETALLRLTCEAKERREKPVNFKLGRKKRQRK